MSEEMSKEIWCYKKERKIATGLYVTDQEWREKGGDRGEVKYIRADLVPQWQPIETAPKDGTVILVYIQSPLNGDAWCDVVFYNNIRDMFMTGTVCIGHDFVTHWMPPPEPPKGDK